MSTPEVAALGVASEDRKEERRVILASSLGTVFEWYDFYLYATLAPFFASLFFPKGNDTAALLSSFATYAAGFLVRPFGALVFGRIGDLVGRKYTFLVTIVVMGGSTAAVGLMPTYERLGLWAPALLVILRLAQGLALGGEYGGAATYVAEHAPDARRGYNTSWIQTTATLGFFLSLAVIFACRTALSPEAFAGWGWRIPFLVSIVLLAVSIYIRLKLQESPVFQRMKAEGKTSKAPLRESFTVWSNLRTVLIALFGATAGQGVIWYTGQFYALFFLTITLKLDYQTAYVLIAISLLIGTPLFVAFGALSDRIGRKKIMMAGCLLAAATYFPIFQGITHYANPALDRFVTQNPIELTAADCNFHLFPTPRTVYTPCDRAQDFFSKAGLSYRTVASAPGETEAVVARIGPTTLHGWDEAQYKAALQGAGYPTAADPSTINRPMVVLLLSLLMLYVTMVYGPIAAFLVELFPTRIRYTSMSLPYHIGNGWFGGVLPFVTAAIVAAQGNIYAGLWYPIGVAAITLVIGTLLIREQPGKPLHEEA